MPFRIVALPAEPFAPLFALDDEALRARLARRVVADCTPGFPCRVSLIDAALGETLILVNHLHHDAATPFRASHGVYVREGAEPCRADVGEVPVLLRSRTLSLRGFDAEGMLVAADLAEGCDLENAIATMFADAAVSAIHLHFAKPGCYAARVERA
jgi:hypothetical protein